MACINKLLVCISHTRSRSSVVLCGFIHKDTCTVVFLPQSLCHLFPFLVDAWVRTSSWTLLGSDGSGHPCLGVDFSKKLLASFCGVGSSPECLVQQYRNGNGLFWADEGLCFFLPYASASVGNRGPDEWYEDTSCDRIQAVFHMLHLVTESYTWLVVARYCVGCKDIEWDLLLENSSLSKSQSQILCPILTDIFKIYPFSNSQIF